MYIKFQICIYDIKSMDNLKYLTRGWQFLIGRYYNNYWHLKINVNSQLSIIWQ